MFPNTEFRSAFAEASIKTAWRSAQEPGTQGQDAHRLSVAYRAPEIKKPVVSITGTPNLPLGSKSTLAVKLGPDPPPKT